MKKPLAIFFSATLLLSACSSGGDEAQVGTVLQNFRSFSVNIPEDWNKIAADDFANTIPEETVALFVNRIPGDDFIQNVNVVKESLNSDAISLEYAKANILLGSKALLDYREIDTLEASINGISTVVHSFRARNATTDPLRHYVQSYFTSDRNGFTITCVAKEDDLLQQQNCDQVVRSFKLN